VLRNLEHIGVDVLIPIGGDDTLSYGKRLHDEGVNVVGIPKTMDNDVYGTDYCIGFSTCVTRTIELTHRLRTSAGSHERFLVIEVFGRYAGFTALLPTMGGAADRCLIPEYPADVEQLTELMVYDHNRNPSKYSVALVSEGARLKTEEGMSFESDEVAKTGVAPMPDLATEQLLGGHAVLAVGYDDADRHFLVRNSWGDGWGMGGYFTLPYAYLTERSLSSDFWSITLVEG